MNKDTKKTAESIVKDLRRKTRRKFGAEEKIRIVLEGIKSDLSVADLCRREGIQQTLYYKWSKDFFEAGKRRLTGDEIRQADSKQVKGLRRENDDLKQAVAELTLKVRLLKKSLEGLE